MQFGMMSVENHEQWRKLTEEAESAVYTMHGFMALKRHGKPDEVASLVFHLASKDAQGITGSMHTIDGGFAA